MVSEREAELLKRLRRLEGVVEELSGQVEIEAIKHSPSSDNSSSQRDGDPSTDTNAKGTVRVVGMDEGSGNRRAWITRAFRVGDGPPKTAFSAHEPNRVGRLVLDEGKSRYVASPFWASINDEVEEIREMLDDQEFDSDSDTPIPPSDAVTEPNHQSFIMGYSSSDVDLKPLHPLPSQIPFYWQTFLENVQPLVKLLHTPTMNKVIKEVQNNLDCLSKSTEALMFAIYFATITSMNTNEVRFWGVSSVEAPVNILQVHTNFGIEKEPLLKKYRFAVEQALAKASFLNTNEIVTVQALVLFLVCVRRHDDTRFVWSLTGLALRIAQSLGLHRDGSVFGLSPFDTEMRRRLWWQVCILDTRASEDHGSDPSILDYSFDTKFPLSINDDDLDPNATEAPVPREGVSEMTFCLIRYEICNLTRRLTYTPPGDAPCKLAGKQPLSLEEKEELVRNCARHLEKTYLRYCEDAGPLYWVAATVARLIIAKMSLIIYHPLTQPGKPNSLSQDIKDRLFMASIEIIEYSRILESEASTKHWGWLFHVGVF
jgi:Fungal specific transcription factor domain